MNLKEDKEQVINMLTSEDKEIKKLAIDSIRSNYVTNFNYTFSCSVNDGIRLKISKKKDEDYYNMDLFLDCILYSITKKSAMREVLDLIIEYNELKGRQG